MAYVPPPTHVLHPGYAHKTLQAWQGSGPIAPSSLVYPLFIVDADDAKQAIGSMPGQHRWGINRLPEALDGPVADGLAAVLLFGVIDDPARKDGTATAADKPDAPVVRAIRLLRSRYPSLLVMCDLCLCGYTDHGHCGVLQHAPAQVVTSGGDKAAGAQQWVINNQASIDRLSQIAVAYAAAGAHVIAPSDMMDGRIGAIKASLAGAGFGSTVSVMSYAAKFASCFYGPFRDAAHSGMAFGDRSLYQLPPASRGLALRAVARDLAEGADFVMVKPGMPYLDIIRDTADAAKGVPVAVYQVSGEFAMLHHAAAAGALDLRRAVLESLTAFQRAGATVFISYFAPQVLGWLKEGSA